MQSATIYDVLKTGDLALFLPATPYEKLICTVGGLKYVHAGVVERWFKKIFLLHISKEKGMGVIEPLESFYSRLENQQIHFYSVAEAFDTKKVILTMAKFLNKPYGFKAAFFAALRTVLRIKAKIVGNLEDKIDSLTFSPHCSAAISQAFRIAGLDLVPNIPDLLTTPDDLIKYRKCYRVI